MKRLLIGGVVVTSLLALASSGARAETITFDDVSTGSYELLANGYHGMNWENFGVLNTTMPIVLDSGYRNGLVSGDNVAFNGDAAPASISAATAFSFNSAYVSGGWNDGLTVRVLGYLNGQLVNSLSFVVNTSAPTLEVFNWQSVDRLVFSSAGGVPHGYNGAGAHFSMDNLTINAVPEPESYAMLMLGFGLIGAIARRKGKAC